MTWRLACYESIFLYQRYCSGPALTQLGASSGRGVILGRNFSFCYDKDDLQIFL